MQKAFSRAYCARVNYFKKEVIQQKVMFSDGSYFNGWQRVGDDEGILATDNPITVAELQANINGQRGGVSRITAEEFLALQSKKNEPSRPRWREEWKPPPNPLEAKFARSALAARAEPVAAGEAPKPAPPPADASFRPKTSK